MINFLCSWGQLLHYENYRLLLSDFVPSIWFQCSIEIYNEIIVFPKEGVFGYDELNLEFYIDNELIEKLSNGDQMKSIRLMTQKDYIDYKHTGYKSKTKEKKK